MLPRPTPASRKPMNAMNHGVMNGRSLASLAQHSTPAGERLLDLVTAALEEAGPERRQAAADARAVSFNEMASTQLAFVKALGNLKKINCSRVKTQIEPRVRCTASWCKT